MEIRILDEHHEAYACLEAMVQSGVMGRPLALVHVDSHEDLDVPLGGESCYELSARQYVERNLTAGDFILPLLLKGYVKKVIHVNCRDEACIKSNVGSLGGEGKLIRTDIAPRHLKFFPDRKNWLYQKTSDIAALSDFVRGYDVLLDIDCDYFSWHRVPQAAYPFPWTAVQQASINRHTVSDDECRLKLRLLPHQMPTINRLTFNDSKAWIQLLIDYFCFYLNVLPRWTFIARSVKSGFTPKKHIGMIEKRLVQRLKQPPAHLTLPLEEKLELTPFVAQHGQQGYSFSTNQSLMDDPLEKIILTGMAKKQSLGAMKRVFLKRCSSNEERADYLFLRTLFNLKKKFILR